MTIAIIPVIILIMDCLIFAVDAAINISGLIRMDKETFMRSGIDEMLGTVMEMITTICVVMLLFTLL